MKTQHTQGSFITVIWTLMGKVKELFATSVPIPPRAERMADLLLLPVVTRTMHRQRAEEARLSGPVFRYSSSHPGAPSSASSYTSARC